MVMKQNQACFFFKYVYVFKRYFSFSQSSFIFFFTFPCSGRLQSSNIFSRVQKFWIRRQVRKLQKIQVFLMKKNLQRRKQHFHLSTVSYFHSGLQCKRITHHAKDVLSLWSTQSLIFTRTTNKDVDTAFIRIFPIQICWQGTGMTSHCVQLLHSSSAKMIQDPTAIRQY